VKIDLWLQRSWSLLHLRSSYYLIDRLLNWWLIEDIEIEVVEIIEIPPYLVGGGARRFFRRHWWLSGLGVKILEVCPKWIEPIIVTSKRVLGGSEWCRRLGWWRCRGLRSARR
jgi:hypothetical protein